MHRHQRMTTSWIASHLGSHLIVDRITSHLMASHLITSQGISSHLIKSHLISSHLIISHLITSHHIASHQRFWVGLRFWVGFRDKSVYKFFIHHIASHLITSLHIAWWPWAYPSLFSYNLYSPAIIRLGAEIIFLINIIMNESDFEDSHIFVDLQFWRLLIQ